MLAAILLFGFLGSESPEIQANGFAPKKESLTIRFEEDLRISPDSGKSYHLFTGGTVSVDVDHNGNMYVLDPSEERILRFDAKGEYLGQIGRSGRGPGEFLNLAGFQVLADGRAFALQDVQGVYLLSRFNKSMVFEDRVSNKRSNIHNQSMIFAPDGNLMAGLFLRTDNNKTVLAHGVFDRNLDLVKTLNETELEQFDYRMPESHERYVKELGHYMRPAAQGLHHAVFSDEGKLYTANSAHYEITRWDSNLNKELVFSKEYQPSFQNDAEKAAMVEPLTSLVLSSISPEDRHKLTDKVLADALTYAGFTDKKHPIYGLVPMEDGMLLVIHEVHYIERRIQADIFSERGLHLGSTSLPYIDVTNVWASPRRLLFRGGFAYAIETNESAECELVRYKYSLQAQ